MRIGSTKKEAKFEEAVVAVPYKVLKGVREFIKFPSATALRGSVPASYTRLAAAMNKYVFPPKFDFTRFSTVDTLMMYVFEFSADLTQEDIANMWQNLPPSIATEFKTQNAIVEERELIDSIVSKDKDVEWMVFKVKKRAQSDFELVRRAQVTNDLTSLTPRITTPYSYNWPYDYFSLVELAKITEGVDYVSVDLKQGAAMSELESLDVDRSVTAAGRVTRMASAYQSAPGIAEDTGDTVAQSIGVDDIEASPGGGGGRLGDPVFRSRDSTGGEKQSTVYTSTSGKGSGQSTFAGVTYSSGQSTVYTSTSGKGSEQASAGSSGVGTGGGSYGGTTNYGSSHEGGGSQEQPPPQYPPPGSF